MIDISVKVSRILNENNLSLVSAESCTGGWIAKVMTDIAGSSTVFDRGFVTYSNQSKHEMLDVDNNTLKEFGAVSERVVVEMVKGALNYSQADIAVAVSGIAGPSGGTKEKPVGMVCFAWMRRGNKAIAKTALFEGDRDSVRIQAVEYSLIGVIELIDGTLV